MGLSPPNEPALETWLFQPMLGAIDPDGRMVLADYNNYVIRRLDEDGILRTVVGNGAHGYAKVGAPALECKLENPIDVEVGADGAYFVNEQHGARILRVDPVTGVVDVYAGPPVASGADRYSGDGGPARGAGLSQGVGIALASDGTLYIADTGNQAIRYVTPDGTIDTLAGGHIEEGFVDGVGTDARFRLPWGLAVDDAYVYVTDPGNSAIRRIDRDTAEVVTIAGTGTSGSDGDGGPALDAHLAGPTGIALGTDGDLYFTDSENDAVRRISLADGTITTVVGQLGSDGFAGDGGPPEDALLAWPQDVQITPSGDLYVIDTLNSRVRRVKAFLPPAP
jgi:sugar lactone lactonase YvrE